MKRTKKIILIINELEITDKVFISIDRDRSVCLSLEKIYNEFSSQYHFSFANGGDQNNSICIENKFVKNWESN